MLCRVGEGAKRLLRVRPEGYRAQKSDLYALSSCRRDRGLADTGSYAVSDKDYIRVIALVFLVLRLLLGDLVITLVAVDYDMLEASFGFCRGSLLYSSFFCRRFPFVAHVFSGISRFDESSKSTGSII